MPSALRVLIIEDSESDAGLLQRELQGSGYEVTARRVETEADMLAALRTAEWDVILGDYTLPHFNGLAALKVVKKQNPDIPFIFVSGTVGEETAVRAMQEGAADYLLKDRLARLGPAVGQALETKRLRIEKRLAEEELKFRNAILSTQQDTSLDGILVVDENAKVVSINRRFVEMWGFPQEWNENQDEETRLRYMSGKLADPGSFLERVRNLYEHREETSREEILLRDGRVFDRYSAPMWGADKRYYGRVWYFRDITERKQMEAEFRQSQKMEAFGQLAGGVAHDFNNILAVILGYTGMMIHEENTQPEVKERLQRVHAAAERAANLTRQLLTFSRRKQLKVVPLNLNGVITNITKMLGRIIGEDIKLVCHCAADLPSISADEGMMEQVLMNLAVNARDAMPQGGQLIISTDRLVADKAYARGNPEARSGEFVRLSMRDTGCGMPPEIKARIFEPFFTTKDVGKGTGLGLATVYGIVKQHQGWIEVESEMGLEPPSRFCCPPARNQPGLSTKRRRRRRFPAAAKRFCWSRMKRRCAN